MQRSGRPILSVPADADRPVGWPETVRQPFHSAATSMEGGELSKLLSKQIVKGDTRFIVVGLHGLANIDDGLVQLRVGSRQTELLLQEAVPNAIPLRLVLASHI